MQVIITVLLCLCAWQGLHVLEAPWLLWLSSYQQRHFSGPSVFVHTSRVILSLLLLPPWQFSPLKAYVFTLHFMLVSVALYTSVCNTHHFTFTQFHRIFSTHSPYVTSHAKTMLPVQLDGLRQRESHCQFCLTLPLTEHCWVLLSSCNVWCMLASTFFLVRFYNPTKTY